MPYSRVSELPRSAKIIDRLEIKNQQDENLKSQLDKIDWPIYYGVVKIQIRQGKPTLVTVERTIKLD